MNRCILMYFQRGDLQQKDVWFENFAEAWQFTRRENFAWESWAILHIGKGINMAYSHEFVNS